MKIDRQPSPWSNRHIMPHLILSLDGNIGAGKSTLLAEIRRALPEIHIVDEPVGQWTSLIHSNGKNLLELFYEDKKRWAYTFQNCAILSRLKMIRDAILHTHLMGDSNQVIITERSILTDKYVFAEMLRDSGDMDPLEWEFSMPVIARARQRGGLFLSQSISDTRYSPLPEETSMASELVKHITDATFEDEVLHSTQPILVDYWAEWCGPCKMIAPILDEVSVSYEGKLKVAKMNVDENREIPAKFGIRGIPTLMLFKDGKLAATKVGALSKAQLVAFIDEQL